MINIVAKIKGIKYTPLLCRRLHTYTLKELKEALSKDATFILKIDNKNQFALSWWVSPKRTRSYPYARVYDSLSFAGKKVTIIPIVKDEGKEGDRDFLQWDTISLMSLLGVYVIISYYSEAMQSSKYDKKITKQRFDIKYLKKQIKKLLYYQSDALHWNLSQIENIAKIGKRALDSYEKISQKLGVEMHSKDSAEKRIAELKKGKDVFMNLSRNLAKMAQRRESITIQPKEHLNGIKGMITITNYLGGNYYFTIDEIKLWDKKIYLVEAKHTKENKLPSLEDIKDGLLKMILYTNLEDVKIGGEKFISVPLLKLTSGTTKLINLSEAEKAVLKTLKQEALINNFNIQFNNKILKK